MNLQLDRLTDEERQSLMEYDGYATFAGLPQWASLKAEMGRLVGQAVRDLQECRSGDPNVSHALRLTLQARSDIMAAVVGYVESRVEERDRLIKQATEPMEEFE